MADEKKPTSQYESAYELFYVLLGLMLLASIVERVRQYFSGELAGPGSIFWQRVSAFFAVFVIPVFKGFSLFITVATIIGIIHNLMKLNDIAAEERKTYGSKIYDETEDEMVTKNGRWERIIELINSPNTSDWRVAIIEADIMLEDVLRSAGYHGETVGDILKSVEKSDLLALEAAWEAHKIRNNIAHAGSDYQLNEREAKQAITLYEAVFKEFKVI